MYTLWPLPYSIGWKQVTGPTHSRGRIAQGVDTRSGNSWSHLRVCPTQTSGWISHRQRSVQIISILWLLYKCRMDPLWVNNLDIASGDILHTKRIWEKFCYSRKGLLAKQVWAGPGRSGLVLFVLSLGPKEGAPSFLKSLPRFGVGGKEKGWA